MPKLAASFIYHFFVTFSVAIIFVIAVIFESLALSFFGRAYFSNDNNIVALFIKLVGDTTQRITSKRKEAKPVFRRRKQQQSKK